MHIPTTRLRRDRIRSSSIRRHRLCHEFARHLRNHEGESQVLRPSDRHTYEPRQLTTFLQHNRTLTNLFSHSLLLDAFVSTCARLLVLELFFNTTHSQDTCSDIIEAIWTDQRQPSHDVVTSFEWQHSLMRAGVWCRFALGAVHVACVGVLICTSAAQGTVAVAIRNHALQIDNAGESAANADEKEGTKHSWDLKVDVKEDI